MCGAAISSVLIFRVHVVNIEFRNDVDYIGYIKGEEEAIKLYEQKALSVVKGRSILIGVDRKKITEAIESADNLVRVTNIEAKVPNKLEIRVRERYPQYYYDDETSGRMAIMDVTLTIVTDGDDFDKINEMRDENKKLIEISNKYFNVTEDFAEFNQGDSFSDYCVSESDFLKCQRLVDTAALFAGQGMYEDTLNHLFSDIKFGDDIFLDNMIFTIRSEYAQGSIIYIEIRDRDENFPKKIATAWQIFIEISDYDPGRILVESGGGDKVEWKWIAEDGSKSKWGTA